MFVDTLVNVHSSRPPSSNASVLRIDLLGPPAVAWAGQSVALARRQPRALLYRLAASPQPVSRDELCFLFWPDIGETASRRNLTVLLNHLRRELPPAGMLLAAGDAIDLNRAVLVTDMSVFAAASASAWRGRRSDELSQAAGLYRAPFLQGFAVVASPEYETWMTQERLIWERRYLDVLSGLIDAHVVGGEYALAMHAARRYLAIDDRTEDVHRRLMALLVQSGDRAAALQQFDHCADVLEREFNLSPAAETWALFEAIRDGTFDIATATETARQAQAQAAGLVVVAAPTASRVQHRQLPSPPNALIGRAEMTAAARALIQSDRVRLLTFTGPGGSGKTRLCLQVATDVHERFADGIVFVSLASLDDPALVADAIARACGLHEISEHRLAEELRDYLHDKHMLLVLDNFEHLMPAAAQVAGLVACAPRLHVMITSRAALRLSGEHVLAVPPLPLPDLASATPVEHLTQHAAQQPALALLLSRVRTHTPAFNIDAGNVADLTAICVRLDGLPLAIELAAARLKVLSPSALRQRLDESLALLTEGPRDLPERQRMLRATIDWSYQLLALPEQRLLDRLAVFCGGWTLEAAEAIGDPKSGMQPTLDGLTALIDNSLIQRMTATATTTMASASASAPDDDARFGMLETVREFARERLAQSDKAEVAAARRAHAGFFLSLAQRADLGRLRPEREGWLGRMEAEHDNVRAALAWAVKSDARVAVRLAAAIWPLWYVRGHLSEGRAWLARVLACAEPDAVAEVADAESTAQALFGAARLTWTQGGYAAALPLAEAGLRLFETLDGEIGWRGMADCLNLLGEAAMERGEFDQANGLHERTLALGTALGDPQRIAQALFNLGDVAILLGQYDRAAERFERSLALMRVIGDKVGMAHALYHLGKVAHYKSDFALAAQRYTESLTLHQDTGNRHGVALLLTKLGEVLAYRGETRLAVEFFEDSRALCRELGYREGQGMATYNLAYEAYEAGDLAQAEALNQESLLLFEEVGVKWGTGLALGLQGVILASRGDARRAVEEQTRCLALWRELESPRGMVMAFSRLGALAQARGEFDEAERLYRHGLAAAHDSGDRYGMTINLEGLAIVLASQPRAWSASDEQVASLLEDATELREAMGAPLRPIERERIERALASVPMPLPV